MIKTEQQKNKTIKSIKRFQNELDAVLSNDQINDTIKEMQKTSYLSMITELQAEVDEYNKLVSGEYEFPETIPINDLPKYIAKFRISKGLSQTELAKRLKIDKQQINRYEEHDYQSVSWARILEIIQVLEISPSINLHESSGILTPVQIQYVADSFYTELDSIVGEFIKDYQDLSINTLCIGMNILERTAILGLLVKAPKPADSFISTFKELTAPLFKKHDMVQVSISFIVQLMVNDFKDDKVTLISSVKRKSRVAEVKELAICS